MEIKREGVYLAAHLPGQTPGWAGPPGRASHRLPLLVGRGGRQRTHARGATPPPCSRASPRRLEAPPRRRSGPPGLSLTLPGPFPLLRSLSRTHPRETATAVRCHRAQSRALTFQPCPKAPSRRPQSPRRATHRRTPCDDASELVTAASAARLCPSIYVVQCLPELNDGAVRISVRLRSFSP